MSERLTGQKKRLRPVKILISSKCHRAYPGSGSGRLVGLPRMSNPTDSSNKKKRKEKKKSLKLLAYLPDK